MQRCILLLSLFSALFAASVHASPFSYLPNEGFYISSTASLSVPHDSSIDFTGGGGSGDLEFNNGVGVTAAIGHHFLDSWRLELEYSFRSNDTDRLVNLPAGNGTVDGTLASHSLMLNFLYDVNLNYHFFWYGGAGVGFSRTRMELRGQDDTDLVFAHQMLTGFGYRLSKQTSFLVGYRLLHRFKQDYEFGGTSVEVGGPWMHIFEVGLRYDF